MASRIVQTSEKVTLVGAGPVKTGTLKDALTLAPYCVAVDGGTELVQKCGIQPSFVIGDMDSASGSDLSRLDPSRVHPIAEQETTDFDKALRNVSSPLIIGVGFTGGRIDHSLANFSTLIKYAESRVILLSKHEIIFHIPRELDLELPVGLRFSVHPMVPVRASSTGLEWPLDPHVFEPGGMLGVSNRVSAATVHIKPDCPGLLAILPRQALARAAEALTCSRQIT